MPNSRFWRGRAALFAALVVLICVTSTVAGAQSTPRSAPGRTGTSAPPPPRSRDTQRANSSEENGARSDVIWVEGGLGYSYVDIAQLDYDQLLPEGVRLSGSGPAATLAAGVKIAILAIGVRGNFASYVGFDVGSIVLDASLRLPVPVIEPYFRVGFGYAWLGDANYDHPRRSETDVSGSTLEGGAGLDVYVAPWLALGIGFDLAFLFMTREGIDVGCTTSCDPTSETIGKDGDSVGLQGRLHAHASLHF